MATVITSDTGYVALEAFNTSIFQAGGLVFHSDQTYVIALDKGYGLCISGSGLGKVDQYGLPRAGVITDIQFVYNNENVLSIEGVSISAKQLSHIVGMPLGDLPLLNLLYGGDDHMIAGMNGAELVGLDGDDVMDGGAGDDVLVGMKGHDTLKGGDGGDTLYGAQDADQLTGGAGADIFLFKDLADSHGAQRDTIGDLDDAQDTIDLSFIDADAGVDGDQAFTLTGAFSGAAGELVLSHKTAADITLVMADVNGDGRADFTVRIAGDHHDFASFVL